MLPAVMLGDAGVTAMLESVGALTAVTVSEAVPLTPFSAAVMVQVPAATPVARPLVLMLAQAALEEVHATCVVRSEVEPSEYLPVAVNC